jgi:cytosine/uracil/thiamine/allantoin permease
MIGALSITRPGLVNTLANAYDITSFFSFVLAWLATVLMLKEYSKRINKFVFWAVVILPLVFFLSRYELALYYFVSDPGVDVLASINVSSDIYGSKTLETILNLNLQLGGAFFGVAFLTIASKLTGRGQQRKALILTGIGITTNLSQTCQI